jgi:hypothetical protein
MLSKTIDLGMKRLSAKAPFHTIGGMLLWVFVAAADTTRVEIIVDAELAASGLIAQKLNRYVSDIVKQGYQPAVTEDSFEDAAALRSYLASQYASGGLGGAILIGDLPIAMYEYDGERFPCDLYFQDLDGVWEDSDNDSYLDKHTGDVIPEIWIGRLLTSKLTSLHEGRTEASLLNDYFDKNHAYRTGQLSITPRGLVYVDDDWTSSGILNRYIILKSLPDSRIE